MRVISAVCFALLATFVLVACGSGGSSTVVARVDATPITAVQLNHEISLLGAGRGAQAASEHDPKLRAHALETLIADRWILGEAALRGVSPTAREVAAGVAAKRRASFPGGVAEWRAFLREAGQTVADVETEVRVERAAARLRASIARSAERASAAEVASYYLANKRRYEIPLRREIRITNRKSAAAADRLKREVAAGKRFVTTSTRELVPLPTYPGETYARDHLDPAIAAARMNVLSGPVKQRVDYFIFEVTHVRPPAVETLERVKPAIERELDVAARHRAFARFLEQWRARWQASTSCARGHVVNGCRERSAAPPSEGEFELE